MPGPVFLFWQHRGLSWAGIAQRAQEYSSQHREIVSMGALPSPVLPLSPWRQHIPKCPGWKFTCGGNLLLVQPSEALQHTHRGVGFSGKAKDQRPEGTKLGGAFAKEGRVAGSYAWAPFLYPSCPAAACALWTSSFWLGREAPRTRIQGYPGQGRCGPLSQAAKRGVTLGLQTLSGHFRTVLLPTVVEEVVDCSKRQKLSLLAFLSTGIRGMESWGAGGTFYCLRRMSAPRQKHSVGSVGITSLPRLSQTPLFYKEEAATVAVLK